MKHTHKDGCDRSNYSDWLTHVAPDILWHFVQDWGSYSGQVYGIGEYKNQLLIYKDYYGSCSGCGRWGGCEPEEEGGEPQDQEEVLGKSKMFTDVKTAKKYLREDNDPYYDERPDYEAFDKAIDTILTQIK